MFACMCECADTVQGPRAGTVQGLTETSRASLGPQLMTNRQCYVCRPVCEGQASSEKVKSCTPAAALWLSPALGSPQDLFLYISFTTRVPPSDFPVCSSFRACSHLEMASQICKMQKSKVRKAPKIRRFSHAWTQAEQNGHSPSRG